MNEEQKPEGRNVGLSAGLDAARRMEAAARADNAIAFAKAKHAWDESGSHAGPVADAVQRLRGAWYHDGSPAARLECRRAMAGLKRAIASNARS